MVYFTGDYIAFFKELAANNHRDWFHANKKRYEQSVKDPFYDFLGELINRYKAIDSRVAMEPKNAVFRINRDIRFSKDKSPYKLSMSALISPAGKKDHSVPGIYVQMGPEDVRLYSGAHMLEKEDLYNVREAIAKNPKPFEKLINEKGFLNKFGEIHGEKMKRIPKEFRDAAESQPLLFNKGFYYFAKWEPEFILKDKLVDTLMDYFQAAGPLNAFFEKALKR